MKGCFTHLKPVILALAFLFSVRCSTPTSHPTELGELDGQPFLEGNPAYLASPFVTAGDRVYLVGHQDGSFPALGWHITGEMGGLWDHPIKLLDGFAVQLQIQNKADIFCLDQAERFINYPVANTHHFNWTDESITFDRTQFVPDETEGMLVEFKIRNSSPEEKTLDFTFTGMVDLRPTWLGERTEMIDGEDDISFDETIKAAVAKDRNHPWYTAFGSSLQATYSNDSGRCASAPQGLGKNGSLTIQVNLKANSETIIPIFIAGSYQSQEQLYDTYNQLKSQARKKLHDKIVRYQKMDSASSLTIADKRIENMYRWLRYNTDWLVRTVPEQGSGISAGLPDYPWWFGADGTYALQGVLATGNHELARNSILLLHQLSKKTNSNGRIIHEVSTNGAVYNPGNVNETAQFITLVRNYFLWTGDIQLVRDVFPDLQNGITWLLEEKDPDGNGYPNGSGMMEIPGLESSLEMVDVACYTQQALASAADLATAIGNTGAAAKYQTRADQLRMRINQQWWQPSENSFGDFRGTVTEAAPILQAALVRSDTLGKTWAVEELRKTERTMKKYNNRVQVPHVIYHNWVVNTPMETGIADLEKGRLALTTSKKYENPFGVFVTGIDRTVEPDSLVLKSRKKTFSYLGAVMTLPTGVQAVAAARYGSPEDALDYILKLERSFSYALPGSMYEVSPDFGMITQAWNIYGVAVPIVQYFFGFQPNAYAKTVTLSPRMPTHWKDASLDRVRVGDNAVSISVHQQDDHAEYHIQQTQKDWSLRFDIRSAKRVIVNGKEVDRKVAGNFLALSGTDNQVTLY